MTTVLHRARLGLADSISSVVLEADQVARVQDVGAPFPPGAEVLDLDGRTVLPGLWDHHVHLDQWSLVQHWVDLTGTTGPAEVVSLIRNRLRLGRPPHQLPLVGYGFRDGLWSQPPHRALLDAVTAELPLVMVGWDLHQAWLNSAALRRYAMFDPDHDGIVREDAWMPIMADLRTVPTPVLDQWVAEAATAAAARGVVGVVDYESADNLASWPRRTAATGLVLRVHASVWPDHLEDAIEAGLQTGDVVPGTAGLVTLGSLKVITDGSLNTRTAYCDDAYPGEPGNRGVLTVPPTELVPLMRRAWSHGITAAIHAIGDHANALALDAFAATGARGSIEHAQLLRPADVRRFAELGVVASVQPEHALDDRDLADRYWSGRTERAFPFLDLHRTGAVLALGSDAPVAPLDPWVTLAAAVSRSRDGLAPWHPEQELDLTTALAASTASKRVVPQAGDPADLVVVDLDLRTATAEQLRAASVAGTLLAGRWTHRATI
ncbi:MAG: amidohydrolase [Propionibacteriaceae bacterium]